MTSIEYVTGAALSFACLLPLNFCEIHQWQSKKTTVGQISLIPPTDLNLTISVRRKDHHVYDGVSIRNARNFFASTGVFTALQFRLRRRSTKHEHRASSHCRVGAAACSGWA